MAKSKKTSLSALDYLSKPKPQELGAMCVAFGDELYLKRQVLARVRAQVLGSKGEESDFSLTEFQGKETEYREVMDALSSVSLFGTSDRLVIIEEADTFVTQFRAQLENYLSRPFAGALLVLEVKAWPSNTRLAKALVTSGKAIECTTPTETQARTWITQYAKKSFDVTLDPSAAEALIDLLPLELGLLEQEIARLSLLVSENRLIDYPLVKDNVGGWRTRKAWDMIDAMAEGKAAFALEQLDRLLAAGEQPIGLLAQMATTLRKFAAAVTLFEQAEKVGRRISLRSALEQAGVMKFHLNKAESQLKIIGRLRAKEIDTWLLEADLSLKGYNSTPPRARIVLEKIIVQLSKNMSRQ